jgi:hypothetical protein
LNFGKRSNGHKKYVWQEGAFVIVDDFIWSTETFKVEIQLLIQMEKMEENGKLAGEIGKD